MNSFQEVVLFEGNGLKGLKWIKKIGQTTDLAVKSGTEIKTHILTVC